MKIGNRIKKLRLKNKLSQAALAEKCGWSRALHALNGRAYNPGQVKIATYEGNTRIPPSAAVVKLAQVFNVSTDYLLGNPKVKKNITKSIDS